MFNDFLIGKQKWSLYVIEAYIIHDLYYIYIYICSEGIYHINLKSLV